MDSLDFPGSLDLSLPRRVVGGLGAMALMGKLAPYWEAIILQ